MKHKLSYLILLWLLQSCITINLYQSKPKKTGNDSPKATTQTMLPMGKTIELDGAEHELLFFGEDGNKTFDVFSSSHNDSLNSTTILIKSATVSNVSEGHWTAKDGDATIKVLASKRGATALLIIIDGEKAAKGFSISEIQPDSIETIHLLKGPAASEKYGAEAANGVLEITTKQ